MGAKVIVTLGTGLALAACGSTAGGGAGGHGGSGTANCAVGATMPAIPSSGMVVWMADGRTYTASNGVRNDAYHADTIAVDYREFLMDIVGFTPLNETCSLVGRLPTIPPAVGTYPIVRADAPLADDSFQGVLTSVGSSRRSTSRCGQVMVTKSEIGDIEGTFAMEADPYPANLPTMTIVGAFNVGCISGMPCGPYSAIGTCADLLACCAATSNGALKDHCMTAYATAMATGETTCGNVLAIEKPGVCP